MPKDMIEDWHPNLHNSAFLILNAVRALQLGKIPSQCHWSLGRQPQEPALKRSFVHYELNL